MAASPIRFELVNSPSPEIAIDGNTGVIFSTATLQKALIPVSVKAINEGGEATFLDIFSNPDQQCKLQTQQFDLQRICFGYSQT